MITPAQHAEVRRLYYAEHWTIGTIATQLGVHHETVAAALNRASVLTRGGRCRSTALDPYLPLREHLKRSKGPGAVALEPGRGAPPTHDVLGFLVEQAPLADWQREILALVRAEAYYFQPQRMTRIMNEGWASFWHSRLLTGGILDATEIIGAGVVAPGAYAVWCSVAASGVNGGVIVPLAAGECVVLHVPPRYLRQADLENDLKGGIG